LWLAQLLSVVGDQLARVALTVLVYDRTRSALLAAITFVVSIVPTFFGGVTLEQFAKKTGVTVKVLHKIDTRFANEQLYRNGSLGNYVEGYLRNPMMRAYEALPRPA